MKNKDALLYTKTVFIYELDSDLRERLVRHFSRAGFRVLCLEYLVQVLKRSDDIEPDVILCNPARHQEQVYNNIMEMRHANVTSKYAFMVYQMEHDDPWVDKFLEAGVYNVIEPHTPMAEMIRIVDSRERMNRRVNMTELIQEERQTPDGTSYWYVMPKAQTQPQLQSMLEQVVDKKLPMHMELLVLRLEFCLEINETNQNLIFAISEALLADGIRTMLIAPPKDLVPKILDKEIPCFPSMLEFNNSFLVLGRGGKSPVSKGSTATATSTLDLGSLLDMIPD